jgi:alpha-tubulin suppressor-like RCC1 family protein
LGLGANNVTDSHVPAPVAGLANVSRVVTGAKHTCALLKDGTVQCWGSNVHASLGRGTFDPTSPTVAHGAPQPVLAAVGGSPFGGVKEIASGPGAEHTCVMLTNGEGWCWGQNGFGQIGNGVSVSGDNGQTVPAAVCTSGSGCTNGMAFTAFTVAGSSTCAAPPGGVSNGYCWGYNGTGQLALQPQDFTAHPNPIATNPGGSGSTLVMGESSGCTLPKDGTGRVECWGSDTNGLLGNGATSGTYTTPQFVCVNANCQSSTLDQLANVSQVSVGGAVCVVQLGAAKCWGPNDKGQLGDGTTGANLSLATSTAIAAKVSAVSVGDAHACALLMDGTVQCWGYDLNGQLGDDDPAGLTKRTPVSPHW